MLFRSIIINMWRRIKTHDIIKERQKHIAILVGLTVFIGSIINLFTQKPRTTTGELNNSSFATSYYIIFMALTVGGMVLYYLNQFGNEQMFIYYGMILLLSFGVIEYYKQKI